MPAGELARVEADGEDLPLRDAQLDAAADQARIERVVVAVDAHVRIGRHARDQATVDVGPPLRQRPHQRQLLGQPVDRAAAERAMEANVGALAEPTVELLLEVELVGERAARLEARLHVALQPLDHALRLRIARLQEAPADPQLAAEGGERIGRAAAARVQRALAVPDERLRQRTQFRKTVADPVEQVGRLLREHQRAGAGTRERETTDDDVAAPRLAAPNRDLAARLPNVELAERAWTIRRALERARPRQKQRPHLAQVIVEDRLGADVALLLEQLAHPLARQPRIQTQQPLHLVAKRVELRRARRAPILGRRARAQRTPDRVTTVAGAPDDLLDRQPLHEIQAADLRPLLHPDHNLPLARNRSTERGSRPTRTAPPAPSAGQLSTGHRGSVLNRRRYSRARRAQRSPF